jgi:transcriptional regulator with XRE-family HTH domain
MGTKEDIGKKIKALREKKNLTQAEVAEKAGIHPNYYARVERGEVDARTNIIQKIAKALGVKSSDILPF